MKINVSQIELHDHDIYVQVDFCEEVEGYKRPPLCTAYVRVQRKKHIDLPLKEIEDRAIRSVPDLLRECISLCESGRRP